MSFSTDVKSELSEQKIKRYCCRSYFLLGLLCDVSLKEIDGATYGSYSTVSYECCQLVEKSIRQLWKTEVLYSEGMRMGEPYYTLDFKLPKWGEPLLQMEKSDEDIFDGSSCPSCKRCFIQGAFVSIGTVSDPKTGYHLEFKLKNPNRAKTLYKLLTEECYEPKIVNRKNGSGLYYKSSVVIEDVLTYLGAVQCLFEFMNEKINRDIRNTVNRTTNCLAGNISKSVEAAQKQIAAINELDAAGKLQVLPDELFETAKLRRELASASLAELARAHNPPISKSGLTHRLAKIAEIAAELEK